MFPVVTTAPVLRSRSADSLFLLEACQFVALIQAPRCVQRDRPAVQGVASPSVLPGLLRPGNAGWLHLSRCFLFPRANERAGGIRIRKLWRLLLKRRHRP